MGWELWENFEITLEQGQLILKDFYLLGSFMECFKDPWLAVSISMYKCACMEAKGSNSIVPTFIRCILLVE